MRARDQKLGRALGTGAQETKRLTALTARRREQSLARFMESLRNGPEFTDEREIWHPIG